MQSSKKKNPRFRGFERSGRACEMIHILNAHTDSIPECVWRQADWALYGDRTCTRANMEFSCFASEFCAMERTVPLRNHVTDSDRSLVAVLADPEDGTPTQFAGCICASRGLVDNVPDGMRAAVARGWMIHTFCVSHGVRGSGVGKRLLSTMRTLLGPDASLYLQVLTAGCGAMRSVMQPRMDRLAGTYKTLGFAYCGATPTHRLYRYAPSAARQYRGSASPSMRRGRRTPARNPRRHRGASSSSTARSVVAAGRRR